MTRAEKMATNCPGTISHEVYKIAFKLGIFTEFQHTFHFDWSGNSGGSFEPQWQKFSSHNSTQRRRTNRHSNFFSAVAFELVMRQNLIVVIRQNRMIYLFLWFAPFCHWEFKTLPTTKLRATPFQKRKNDETLRLLISAELQSFKRMANTIINCHWNKKVKLGLAVETIDSFTV